MNQTPVSHILPLHGVGKSMVAGLRKKFSHFNLHSASAPVELPLPEEPCETADNEPLHFYSGLTDEQKLYCGDSSIQLFAVVSWGCTATTWLARALNSHPDIFCVHHVNLIWSKIGHAPYLDGLDYLRIICGEGYGHLAVGDVHGICRDKIPAIKAALGDRFACAVLVREPIRRLRSQMGLFEQAHQFGSWDVDYLNEDVIPKLNLPDHSYLTRLFVHGANCLNGIIYEQKLGPVFTSEALTSQPEALCNFVRYITHEKVESDIDWAIACIKKGKLNVHINDTQAEQPFLPWQIEVLREVVRPEAWKLYENLGYPKPDFID